MDSGLIELGKRAMACKGWRWMPGMRPIRCWSGADWTPAPSPLTHRRSPYGPPGNQDYDWPHDLALCIPDLSDPATVGCLLVLVQAVHGEYSFVESPATFNRVDGYVLHTSPDPDTRYYAWPPQDTYAEALVVALEKSQEVHGG